MSIFKIVSSFHRLTLSNPLQSSIFSRKISTHNKLQFHVTATVLAEPLKKKKRLDPAIIKHREERKKRKIEKQIRKLEKNAKQLKPIEECEVPICLLSEREIRMRNIEVPSTVAEQRILLEKKWALFKQKQHLKDIQMLDNIMFAQQKALDELRKESEELYQAAIQIDENLVPFNCEGPKETPPIEGYDPPDGDITDISKVW